jgi:hypothetical protein
LPEESSISTPPQQDQGLRCLECEYNLTGLTGSVCPECGTEIDWDKVRAVRDQELSRPGTYWDTWTWYYKPFGFIATTLQVALTPWIFARQLPLRPQLGWAMAFAAICLASIALFPPDKETLTLWVPSSFVYIFIQAGLFGLILKPKHVKHPYRFWMVVSCYTSYPILIERIFGPPPPIILFGLSNIWPMSEINGWWGSTELVPTILIYLWLANIVCIAAMRSVKPVRSILIAIISVAAMTVAVSYFGFYIEKTIG